MILYPTVCKDKKKNIVFGHCVPKYVIRYSLPKICPDCFRDSGYIRKLWELSPVTCCPIHKCMLIEYCPKCHKRIRWGKSISACSCGFKWEDAKAQQVSDSDYEMTLTERIFTLCCQYSGMNSLLKKTPLYDLDLEHLLKAVFFIAGQLMNTTDTTGKVVATLNNNEKIHGLLSKALSVFMNWPSNYFAFLDDLTRKPSTSISVIGLDQDFGVFYRLLYRQMSALNFLSNAFEEYLYTNWRKCYYQMLRIGSMDSEKRKYVTRNEAVKILRVSREWVDYFFDHGEIAGIRKKVKERNICLIEKESLFSLKKVFSMSISFPEAKAFLGVGEKALNSLIESGLIQPLRGPGVDGFFRRRFSKESLEKFISSIKIKNKTDEDNLKTISFSTCLRKLIFLRIGIVELINLMNQNVLVPCGYSKNKKGLQLLMFYEADVLEYINNRVLSTKQEGLYSMEEISKKLGNGMQSTCMLNKRGFFGNVIDGIYGGSLITQESLDSFEHKYIFCSALAKATGKSSRYLIDILSRHGITPASGPNVDGNPKYLYKKEDIKNIFKMMPEGYLLSVNLEVANCKINCASALS